MGNNQALSLTALYREITYLGQPVMGKNKLQRFKEIAGFDHVFEQTDFQNRESGELRGHWNSAVFGNMNPIVLELACGKGEYTVELAGLYPERNFIGIDIKGARIWKGAKRVLERELNNVRFLRIYIDHLATYFGEAEVDEMWITFPDPYPRKSNRSKRLSSPKFLAIYRNILKRGGTIHFKTDSDKLFEYTRQILEAEKYMVLDLVRDVYSERPDDPLLTIQTYYEKKHLAAGKKIKYVKFKLPRDAIRY